MKTFSKKSKKTLVKKPLMNWLIGLAKTMLLLTKRQDNA